MDTAPRPKIAICMLMMAAAAPCGCGPPFIAEFETAQRLAAQQDKELLVYYQSWIVAECGKMKKAIESPRVQHKLADRVLCILDESYEPYQRLVAQYGVDHYPALILIHRDGTYHQHSGALSADAIINFIETARAPGRRPIINPQIPRRIDYRWQADYEHAFKLAEQQNRPVFIFYKSVISADCNEMLFNVLNRPDVAVHFNDTVNCLLDWYYPPNRRLMARYGVTNVPGIVIVNPDGTHHARQGRMTAPQVISFVRGAKASARPSPPGS